jgi:hypothetical protein|tara:strand:+ start:546 stop:647 length:102 start_codon:yes stop_codon:yes gene_type:complete
MGRNKKIILHGKMRIEKNSDNRYFGINQKMRGD